MTFVGDSVRKLRRQLGWTLEGLASKVGISKSRLSSIERGASEPAALQVVHLAQVFGEPALMLAKCRECEIRVAGFEEFFPEIDLSSYAELSSVLKQLRTDLRLIEEQSRIVHGMYFGTEEFNVQFTKLREMLRSFSYASAVAANVADLTVFLKRGFLKFGK